ncbi:protein disaggregation chaperone, partial [mine drainage metagenome]
DRRRLLEPVLRAHFRPEFLNRLDEIVVFHSLGPEQIGRIVDLQFALIEARLQPRRIRLRATAPARSWLAAQGYDSQFGARPLRRTLQRLVLDPLTTRLLEGKIADGSEVTINLRNGELELTAAAPGRSE